MVRGALTNKYTFKGNIVVRSMGFEKNSLFSRSGDIIVVIIVANVHGTKQQTICDRVGREIYQSDQPVYITYKIEFPVDRFTKQERKSPRHAFFVFSRDRFRRY